NKKLLVFFYVNNIVVLAKLAYITSLSNFKRKLLRCYKIRSLEELLTFYSIQTHCNRLSKSI
ncbi:hypothetical protein IQ07DRAFT_509905, partial [Pyrenochaeta sp. DS3sAY3a]